MFAESECFLAAAFNAGRKGAPPPDLMSSNLERVCAPFCTHLSTPSGSPVAAAKTQVLGILCRRFAGSAGSSAEPPSVTTMMSVGIVLLRVSISSRAMSKA